LKGLQNQTLHCYITTTYYQALAEHSIKQDFPFNGLIFKIGNKRKVVFNAIQSAERKQKSKQY